jgi:6-pyruvoyltetrahydropterin/6-carboxytetrahydropterin synthase|tara:strand:- start:1019 stop:1369 length:351 start_codon:yes stop_codon:yes gene_type:complete
VKLFKEFTFEAAHQLPLVPKDHKCFQLHGHSFKVRVYVQGPLNEMGWVMDFAELKASCNPWIEKLDHSYLNKIKGLDNPTSENIAIWLWDRIIKTLPNLSTIEVQETCNSGCMYEG